MKPASSLLFTSILFVLSAVVAGLNGFDGDPQPFVIVYWVVLSGKYVMEIIYLIKKRIQEKRIEKFFAKKLNY